MISLHRGRVLPAGLALGVAAATVVVLTAGSAPVSAADAPVPSSSATVAVEGAGQSVGLPDVLRVTLAVSKKAPDVTTAMNGANALITKIRAALKADKVADRDIQTAEFRVDSSYSKKTPGYLASQTLQATIRDLDEAGRIIADAAAAGGNATRIYGVSYDIEDRQKLLKEARDLAFTDAKAKAERYASLAGRRLGDVRQVNEGNVQDGYDEGGYGKADPLQKGASLNNVSAGGSRVPLSAGTRTVVIRNSVVWDLG